MGRRNAVCGWFDFWLSLFFSSSTPPLSPSCGPGFGREQTGPSSSRVPHTPIATAVGILLVGGRKGRTEQISSVWWGKHGESCSQLPTSMDTSHHRSRFVLSWWSILDIRTSRPDLHVVSQLSAPVPRRRGVTVSIVYKVRASVPYLVQVDGMFAPRKPSEFF